MTPKHKVTIAAGGDSTRMGRDKAMIRFRGDPLLERIARRATTVADEVCVAGRETPDGWPLFHITFLPDRIPDRGPIEGLRCALRHYRSPTALIACDMPLLTDDALSWLLSTHGEWRETFACTDRSHGLAVRRNGRLEPLFSVYHPSVLDLLEERVEEQQYSLRGLIEAGDFAFEPLPDRFADQIRNVNTPEELEQLP